MGRDLTKAEYLRHVRKPRRRFQKLVVSPSGLRLQQPMPGLSYWFERDDVGEMEGRYVRLRSLPTISLVVDGKPSVLFYPNGKTLESCTFAYDLWPGQLDRAVVALKRAGLGRFVGPAAEWAMREMPQERRAILEKELRALLGTTRAKGGRRGGAVEQRDAAAKRRSVGVRIRARRRS